MNHTQAFPQRMKETKQLYQDLAGDSPARKIRQQVGNPVLIKMIGF